MKLSPRRYEDVSRRMYKIEIFEMYSTTLWEYDTRYLQLGQRERLFGGFGKKSLDFCQSYAPSAP